MSTLSVILITKNEEKNIRECLDSVAWADEIIVVDSGSSDKTISIAQEFTPLVFVHDWPGFGIQKNRALSYATGEWVFSIDADERVTPELKAELIQAMQVGETDGFFCPRLSQFCGKYVRHSGWYPDYVLRLFKRNKGKFSDNLVHESLILQGKSSKLSSPLLHYTYLNMDDVRRKVEHYSASWAQQMYERGKKAYPVDAPVRAAWAFLRTYCFRLGFLDGSAGFQIAKMNASTTYLKYQRLRAMQLTQASL